MKSTPTLDVRYWITLVLASVFGGNTGDFFAVWLGHLAGLPVLAVLFTATLFAEKRIQPSTPILYWVSIIIVRTAATNMGDVFHDLHVDFSISVPAVLLLMAAAVWFYARQRPEILLSPYLRVDGRYWVCMALAGILGTLMGDGASFALRLGTPTATALFFIPFLLMMFLGRSVFLASAVLYWSAVVLVRSGGTSFGDFLAHLLGLPAATAVSGLLFIGAVVMFYVVRPTKPLASLS